MLDLVPLPYKIGLIAIAAVAIAAFSYSKGYDHANDKYLVFAADVRAQQELLRAEHARKLQAVTAVHRQVEHEYAQARAALAAGPRVVRVRDTCSGSGILPGVSDAAKGLDATAEAGAIDPAQCETYLNAGIADATQLIWLQRFIIDAHEASK
jgi:hypothetical protein